jgi:hypothetical protein
VLCVSVPAQAQTAGPAAIYGAPSSARHCLSGDAANVHNLGWVAAQSRYTVQFDADFAVTAAITRFEPTENRASLIDGNPEFNGTAASSGTMVLHVSGNGASGCYRYRATIDPPAASVAGESGPVYERVTPIGERQTRGASGSLAITGNPSSAQHCIAGTGVSSVHELGRVDRASEVFITFDTDFTAVIGATLTVVDPTDNLGSFVVDEKGAGSRSPSMAFSAEAGENIVLFVAGLNGGAGCYKYKVEIR